MYQPRSPHTNLAIDVIERIAKKEDIQKLKLVDVPDELSEQLACFVSIHLTDGNLRGCIGTIQPREKNLYLEIIANAISAATSDSRFSAVEPSELDQIEVSVDVLSKPYLVGNLDELNPKKLGVIVTDGSYSRGVLLPDIDGIETVEKQISIAKRKAGLEKTETALLEIYAFTSTRFY